MDRSEQLAAFLVETSLSDVPSGTIDHAEQMVTDTVSVSLAAVDEEAVQMAVDLERLGGEARTGEPPDSNAARVLGTTHTQSPRSAAFLNGVMAHALDFDDTAQERLCGHPSAPVLPAALAVADAEDASGEQFLRAFVLGVETEMVLGDVMNRGMTDVGWHPTAVLGHFGATAAAGTLLGLDVEEFRRAFGITASQTGGVKANFGTMTKPYHAGNAARAGVEAAALAARGFTASECVFEAEFGGFCRLFAGEGAPDLSALDRLGDTWGITDPPVWFKLYPSCGGTHAPIDAALALVRDHGFDPNDVERVRITEHPRRYPATDCPRPETGLKGKFSVQYCVAVALATGDVWLDDFTDEAVTRPAVRSVLETVEIEEDPDMNKWSARVAVETADGAVYEHDIAEPSGMPGNPLDRSEVLEKYERCASTVLSRERVQRSRDLLADVRSLDAASRLTAELVPG